MTEKFFLGYQNVSLEDYLTAKDRAIADGNVLLEEVDRDKRKNYILKNGILLQGESDGYLHRMADGVPTAEKWQAGTVDEYVQGEATGRGRAEFFFRLPE